jgi:hypothetical protein
MPFLLTTLGQDTLDFFIKYTSYGRPNTILVLQTELLTVVCRSEVGDLSKYAIAHVSLAPCPTESTICSLTCVMERSVENCKHPNLRICKNLFVHRWSILLVSKNTHNALRKIVWENKYWWPGRNCELDWSLRQIAYTTNRNTTCNTKTGNLKTHVWKVDPRKSFPLISSRRWEWQVKL